MALSKPCEVKLTPLQRDVLLNKEELENTSSSPRASTSVSSFLARYFISCILFSIACHIGKFTVVAYLENLPLCQA